MNDTIDKVPRTGLGARVAQYISFVILVAILIGLILDFSTPIDLTWLESVVWVLFACQIAVGIWLVKHLLTKGYNLRAVTGLISCVCTVSLVLFLTLRATQPAPSSPSAPPPPIIPSDSR